MVTKPFGGSSEAQSRGVEGTALAKASVEAFIFTDLTAKIASAETGDDGRYALELPASAVGKDIVLKVTKDGTREAAIVPAVGAGAKVGVDINAATTLGAEIIVAKANTVQPKVTALDSSAVGTVMSEFAKWSGLWQVNCEVPSNSDLPNEFGSGLKADGPAAAFAQGNAAIQAALSKLGATGNASVATAKRMVQWMRDGVSAVSASGEQAGDSVVTALEEQRDVMRNEAQMVTEFSDKTSFVQRVLGLRRNWNDDTLEGKAPGRYTYEVPTGSWMYTFTKTGDAADGKSWIVTSGINDDTSKDTEVTITPSKGIAEFRPDPAAGQMQLIARHPARPEFKIDGTVTLTGNADNRLVGVVLNITIADKSLTKAMTFSGTAAGVPAATQTGGSSNPMQSVTVTNAAVTSQWGTASVGSLVVKWPVSSDQEYVLSAELRNLKASTTLSKPVQAEVTHALIEFEPPAPTQHVDKATPKRAVVESITVSGSGHTLTVTGADATFDRYGVEHNSWWHETVVVPKSAKGQATYRGSVVTFTGSVDAKWENSTARFEFGRSQYTDYPIATVRMIGNLTPKVGEPLNIDLLLASSNANVSSAVKSTFTLTALSHNGESLKGSGSVSYPIGADGIVDGSGSSTGTITHSPSGYVLTVSGTSTDRTTGAVYTNAAKTTKVADIDRADELGLPDLGTALIIKYVDGTFETAASLLPG